MSARARSMSESILAIAFPVLMAIIYLREDIFTNPASSQGYNRVVSIAGHSITVLTISLSTMGIIVWICVYAEEFIPACCTNFVRWVKDFYCNYLIIGKGCLMILTSIAVYLLFKQNHKPLLVSLAIILSLFCLGFIIGFLNKDHGGEVPEKELEYMLELAAGITNLLFAALVARAINTFGSSNENATHTAQLTADSHIKYHLFFLFVGSLSGIFIMVLISVANQNSCSTKIWTLNCLLVIAVMANVLAGTWELLEGYAILEILPGLVYLLVYIWKVKYDQPPPQVPSPTPSQQEGKLPQEPPQQKPVTLSFTNIAFAGLVAAVSFNDKDEEHKFKAFACFASAGLVCAVTWRLLMHGTTNYPKINLIACILTLLLLFSVVITSGFIVWG